MIVAAAHLPGKVPEAERLSEADLVHAMAAARPGRAVHRLRWTTSSPTWRASCATGDRVVILSNGGFGGIHGKLLAALAAPVPLSR